MKTETTAPLLSESEVQAAESRYETAKTKYLAITEGTEWWKHMETPTGVIGQSLTDIPALIRDRRALKAALDDLQVRFGAACEHVKIVEGECRTKDETIAALREQENQQRGLVVISALINFIDWLATQGVLVTNVPESRAAELRADLVKQFLASHSEGENYFMQADQIAEMLGDPF